MLHILVRISSGQGISRLNSYFCIFLFFDWAFSKDDVILWKRNVSDISFLFLKIIFVCLFVFGVYKVLDR